MRNWILIVARVAALAAPTALAFFSGGYFDEARAWAGLGAWVLAGLALALGPGALPRGRPALLALGGMALLAGWTLLSMTWAPVRGSAYHAGQLNLLYLGALLACAALLRGRSVVRAVEPAVLAGALIVIGYGLSEHMLPGLVHLTDSLTAQGRLDQPLSYWNAMGELAAIGFVLAARLTGDATRPAAVRGFAAASTAPLGLGLYLSFSRGALFACVAGLLVLALVARRRSAVRGILVCVGAGVLAALAAAPFRGVTALEGTLATREGQGLIVLGIGVVVMTLAALAALRLVHRGGDAELRVPRRAPAILLAVICAGLALAIVVGAKETTRLPSGTSATRYTTLSTYRYDYWRVALDAFAREPVHGIGAGGWAVDWLRYRHERSYAVDAHSLPLQTLAELGLVGLAFLLAMLAGIVQAARRALARARGLVAGPVAALVVYLAHSPLDWDWQMPALTLLAVLLAGVLIGLASDAQRSSEVSPAKALEAPPARGEAAVRA